MREKEIIRLKNLTLRSGSQCLLQHINWTVKKGENWVVFGRNGSGKTTLLSTIAGFQRFQEGSLEIDGKRYTDENILELRKQIGWISSSFFSRYYQNEKVLDIVISSWYGSLGVHAMAEDDVVIRAKTLLAKLGLKAKIEMPYSNLSKGEQQKVLIARAFMTDPKILIFDEPENGLDVVTREKLSLMMQHLSQSDDYTIIYVTHYLEEILESYDHCLLLRQGTIYKTGETAELFSSETMSDFLNEPVSVLRNDGRMHLKMGRRG